MNMRYIGCILLLCMLMSACHRQEENSPVRDEAIAVRIGDQLITQTDIQNRLKYLSEKDKKFAQTAGGYQNLVQIVTREKLIEADARHNGLDQDADYQAFLKQKREELHQIYNDFEQQLLAQIWYVKQHESGVLDVSDEEIKSYFEKYPYEMTIKQIIVDNAQTADQVLHTLKHNSSQWNTLSHQYNLAPEELRTVSFMPGEYLSDLEVISANSPVGKVQGFFKTPLGFHIIMKTGEKRLNFETAKPRIKQVLESQKLDNVLNSLKTKYEVIIYEKND